MAKYSEFYSIMSAIKRCFSRSPNHREALNKAKCPRRKGPRGGARYVCVECKKDFASKDVQVDHIDPIVPIGTLSKDMTWDEVVGRTFCNISNLQILCKTCHKEKSAEENAERRKIAKSIKSNPK
jgi:5-methylcytosine-specific restriction endonuclease McrA